MDTVKIAKELRRAIDALQQERDELDDKIAVMEETLSKLGVKRGPGRPKGSGKKTGKRAGKKTRKKPQWSAAKRQEAAERMRKYWAEWRKKNAGKKKTTKKKATKKKTSKKKASKKKTPKA